MNTKIISKIFRFYYIYDNIVLKISALLISRFKLDWVQENDEQQKIIEHFKLCLQSFCDNINYNDQSEDTNIDTNMYDDNFYIFKRKKTSTTQSSNISSIIESYLYNNKYDDIKKLSTYTKHL